jgi:hypothetical protein
MKKVVPAWVLSKETSHEKKKKGVLRPHMSRGTHDWAAFKKPRETAGVQGDARGLLSCGRKKKITRTWGLGINSG